MAVRVAVSVEGDVVILLVEDSDIVNGRVILFDCLIKLEVKNEKSKIGR